MLFENLKVSRVTVHEVYKRLADRRRIDPICADVIEKLSPEAIDQFKIRVTSALSAEAKSLKMQIVKFDKHSLLHDLTELVVSDDTKFLELSHLVPGRLADAQLHPNIPGGVVIVFDGTVGSNDNRYIGIIKAEKQSGFRRYRERSTTLTQFLDDLFLTPAQRLYKIAIFVQVVSKQALPNGWEAYVFDTNISPSHRETAAQYFYQAFLGCELPQDGAYETARFFDLTKEFVRKSDFSTEKKRDLVDALVTYIKTDQSVTFTPVEFAEQYLPVSARDPFADFLERKNFPKRAIVRDVSQMGAQLRRRRFRFGEDVELSVSVDALNEKTVEIKEVKAKDHGGEGEERWTQVTIRKPQTDER